MNLAESEFSKKSSNQQKIKNINEGRTTVFARLNDLFKLRLANIKDLKKMKKMKLIKFRLKDSSVLTQDIDLTDFKSVDENYNSSIFFVFIF